MDTQCDKFAFFSNFIDIDYSTNIYKAHIPISFGRAYLHENQIDDSVSMVQPFKVTKLIQEKIAMKSTKQIQDLETHW